MEETPSFLRPFVLTPPDHDAEREANLDWYRPDGDTPRPAVILVHGGPMPPGTSPTPRDWPVFRGYGSLLASLGSIAVTAEHRLQVVVGPDGPFADYPTAAQDVADAVDRVRADPRVDPERIALWFFSGGGLLSTDWLRERPEWLRAVALTYPLLAPLPEWGIDPRFAPAAAIGEAGRPVPPLLLTRVGLERHMLSEPVAVFLRAAGDNGVPADVLDVPNGQHGFDMLDHTDESRQAVEKAATWITERLRGQR
ncbi:alpha/beta hydrolase [Verrucosispora sp. WMMA2121]|uniref:alpha/beta hydrolase n=1 Tax=Verrucosispora sp. WMMA2121 TaxID=3015164 RepID=UPI0022B672B6|nr:alpha/beta hydrolase [Verrucosispora sp. WMMA2121]MCZ7423663.1 alpha/beta hydrolase [Verrucosispora sp. WMMA2121]